MSVFHSLPQSRFASRRKGLGILVKSNLHNLGGGVTLYRSSPEYAYVARDPTEGDLATIMVQDEGDEVRITGFDSESGASNVLGASIVRKIVQAILRDHPRARRVAWQRALGRSVRGGEQASRNVRGRKSLTVYRVKRAGTCKPGERADVTGCTPAMDDPSQQKPATKDQGNSPSQAAQQAPPPDPGPAPVPPTVDAAVHDPDFQSMLQTAGQAIMDSPEQVRRAARAFMKINYTVSKAAVVTAMRLGASAPAVLQKASDCATQFLGLGDTFGGGHDPIAQQCGVGAQMVATIASYALSRAAHWVQRRTGVRGKSLDDTTLPIELQAHHVAVLLRQVLHTIGADETDISEEKIAEWLEAHKDDITPVGEPEFQVKYLVKDKTGGTCKQGERSDLTGCTPASGEASGHTESSEEEDTEAPVKRRADRSEKLVAAKREGKGKDARVILANGQPAPPHITPAMVPPAWSRVKISMNPESDILVQGKQKNALGRFVTKTVYHPRYLANNQAAKFSKIREGLAKMGEMHAQNQKNRQSDDPETRNCADCVWLMQEQATRPGSEADTRGLAAMFGKPVTADDFVVKKTSKKIARGPRKGETITTYSVALNIDGKKVPIRDEGAKKEIVRRLEAGEGMEDSTYWLKSHGATTLEGRHVIPTKEGVRLRFIGKEGVFHDHLIKNPELGKMLLARKKDAGNTGKLFGVSETQVSKYTSTLDGGNYTPKDLRTLRATRNAIDLVKSTPAPRNKEEYQTAVMGVAKKVSGVLGNRPEQALESYIDPTVWAGWRNFEEDK